MSILLSVGMLLKASKTPAGPIQASPTRVEVAQDTWNAAIQMACKSLATADGTKVKDLTKKAYQQLSDYSKK